MTTNRDAELTRLRPTIQANLDQKNISEAELFQNATLRPILKLQNGLLLQVFGHYLQKTKGSFFKLPAPKQLEFIANAIRSDQRLRNLLTGIIVGHFTEDEWQAYATNEPELSRRIADMLVQRLCDNFKPAG